MSYLMSVEEMPSFKKAIISFWFRAPQESVDAANAAANKDDFDFRAPLTTGGVIPLVTFGKIIKNAYSIIANVDDSDSSYTDNMWLVYAPGAVYCTKELVGSSEIGLNQLTQTKSALYTLDPCHIGVDCTSNPPMLRVYLQTAEYAEASKVHGESHSTSGAANNLHSASYVFDGALLPPDTPSLCGNVEQKELTGSPGEDTFVLAGEIWEVTTTLSDGADLWVKSSPEAFGGTSKIEVTPDAWHHVLISFDLTNGKVEATGGQDIDISSSCKMYIAFDDKNYTGTDLPYAGYPGFLGPNDIYTEKALNTTSDSGMPKSKEETVVEVGIVRHSILNSPGGPPTYKFEPHEGIPAGVLGLPAIDDLAKKSIRTVQLAEFLMFVNYQGDAFDTSIEANRRKFITKPDKKGRQFPTNSSPLTIPYRKFAFGDPAKWEPGADNPAYAPPLFDPSAWPTGVKGLGNADVDFTKCSFNWMMGRNLGKVKGKFEKTGKIKAYWPSHDPTTGSDPVLEPKP